MGEFAYALAFNLFDGDFGSGETEVFNEICAAPEAPKCHVCASKIRPGATVRKLVETAVDPEDGCTFTEYERSRKEYYVCETCCGAIETHDEGKIDRRYAMGERRRAKEQGTNENA